MKKFDVRIVMGLLLIVGGGLMLAQTMGYLENVSDYFWGILFVMVGLTFLSLLFSDKNNWWSAIPGFIFLALGALILLPESLEDIGGGIFLGGVALSFWYVYLTDRNGRWWAIIPAGVVTALSLLVIVSEYFEDYSAAIVLGGIGLTFLFVYLTNRTERWWALIPFGVLSTLATITVVSEKVGEFQSAGVFFLGLAITFLLVALLTKMTWAYYPAAVLAVMGIFGLASLLNVMNYVWAVGLIVVGVFVLFRYFMGRA
ncbi:MAG: hypothetical protein UZ14_CFX002001501 [Chloroflexi bacterium OLB14]|nr:MAG: hypothetical protein UZ14_CFX002001501 [Chloroflexi bacterium OLB14]